MAEAVHHAWGLHWASTIQCNPSAMGGAVRMEIILLLVTRDFSSKLLGKNKEFIKPEAGEKALMAGCAKLLNDIHNNIKEKINPIRRVLDSVIGEIIRLRI